MAMEVLKKVTFDPIKPQDVLDIAEIQFRFVQTPQHRYASLLKAWKTEIYDPIRNEMKIDIRMNLKAKRVELKTMLNTPDISNLDKCASFVEAFMLGFDPDQVRDVFLKYDSFYMDTVDMEEEKRTLKGDHLNHAIGRICGKGGKTKFMIENNATKTRIVFASKKIHIVESCDAIKIARDSVRRLILGSPAGKIQSMLKTITARASERF
ncbi:uncharacterized protein LOC130802925 [Amaranthus tricolor]|uniref:uncharacterized protein LOC130802925 n=1 Tax=Amaranthus tricolor TaxID=29722 RepID=UPI00258C064C|nr:uncharacterized protein LOC130802925 [Amaranthus tricolor]